MESEHEVRAILDRLNTAVMTCDDRTRVLTMNPAAESLFGISARQAFHRPVATLMPHACDVLLCAVEKARSTQQSVTAHDVTLTVAPGHSVTVDCTATPMPLSSARGEPVLIELIQVDGFLDMAKHRQREDQYDANRDVLRGLAHEIKNPLGGLRGAAQLLERTLPDRETREFTRIIIHEADRLRNLVDRMMGSIEPISHDPVNIHDVLTHVRKLTLAEIQEGLTIVQDYDPSLPELEGDRDQLIQAVLNITRNSVEALGECGTIIFRTRIQRSVYTGQQWHRCVLKVEIEDDGPGIPAHMQERVFYPMVSGRADGSGLGLSIAQDIVSRHHGSIQLQSEPGRTRFILLLPFFTEESSNGG